MNFLERQLEDPVRFARIKRWFYIGLAALLLAEIVLPLLFHGGHPHFAFERFPAWGSLYGFVSCVAIILVSKFIGKLWLMRPEDHYGERKDD
jgi:uncharacterized membrane protein